MYSFPLVILRLPLSGFLDHERPAGLASGHESTGESHKRLLFADGSPCDPVATGSALLPAVRVQRRSARLKEYSGRLRDTTP